MLGWIEKVVPQPPVIPSTPVIVAPEPEPEAKTLEGNSSQPAGENKEAGPGSTKPSSGQGVLTWLSEGLVKVVPQPSPHNNVPQKDEQKPLEGNSSQLGGENKEAVVTVNPVTPSRTESSGKGVLTWLSEGMGKVVPQPLPHDSVPQKDEKTSNASEQKPAEEKKEAVVTLYPVTPGRTESSGRGVLSWLSEGLGKVVPQPVPHDNVLRKDEKSSDAANQKPSEGNSSQPAEGKKEAAEPVTPGPGSTTESSGKGVLNWLSEGMGKVVPHPHDIVLQQDEKTCDAANQVKGMDLPLDGKSSQLGGDTSCLALNVSVMLKYEEAASIFPASQRLRTYLHIALSPGAENKEAVTAPDPVTPDPHSAIDSSGKKVLTWLSEGMGKVVPHPHDNVIHSDAANQTDGQNVENEGKQETTDPSGAEGKPNSDVNAPVAIVKKTVFSRLMGMIPQPENVKKPEEKTPQKTTADQEPPKESSPTKPPATPHASPNSPSGMNLFPQSLGGDGSSSIFKRIKKGLVQAIPRPVSKEKPGEQQTVEAGGQDARQEISGSKGA